MSNESPVAVTQRTGNPSPAVVVTRHTSDQSSKSTSSPYGYSTQKHQETEANLDDQIQNEKEKCQCSVRLELYKTEKDSVPQGEDKTKNKKTNMTEE